MDDGGEFLHGGSGDFDAAFVGFGDLVDEGADSAPGHGSGPFQGGLDGAEQGSVPVDFEDAPAAFDGVVLAVIGGPVDQFDAESGAVGELGQAFYKLRARAVYFGTVVEFDHDYLDSHMVRAARGPPEFQAVDDKVRRLARAAEEEVELVNFRGAARHFQDAERDQQRVVMHVVIQGLCLVA